MGRSFILLSLILLSGCIKMSKKEETANLLSAPSLQRSAQESAQSTYFKRGEWPDKNWWNSYDSKELNHLINKAMEKNPTLNAIEQKVDFLKAESVIKRSKLFPLISFDYLENWMFVSENGLTHRLNPSLSRNHNVISMALSFDYELDFWGKYRNLFQAALGKVKAEVAQAANVQLMITTSVAQTYYALKTNMIRLALTQDLLEAREELYELEKLKRDKGLVSDLSLYSFEELLLEARKMVEQVVEEVQTNRHLLNLLTGEGPDSDIDLSNHLPNLPHKLSIPENLSADLLSRRPDLMAQIWRVEALAHDVNAAIADFFPNVNLKGLMGLVSNGFTDIFKWESREVGLTPAIHLPIFTAGAIRANVDAKKATFQEAVFDYNELLLQSAQEVADVLVLCESIFAQKQEQEIIADLSGARLDLTAANFEVGLDSKLSVLEKEIEWIEKELENVFLLYNQYVASIKLVKSLGGGYSSDYLPLRGSDD